MLRGRDGWRPVVAVLVLAPVLGDCLTGATPPLNLVFWPPGAVYLVALYGCGALLCREIAYRRGLGLAGLCVLGAAYAVVEEALVDRFWFKPRSPSDGGLGHYGELWHTNVVLATNLTVFHVAVSIVSTIVLVELWFPRFRRRAYLSRRGLTVAGAVFVVLPFALSGEYSPHPLPQLLLALILVVTLVLLAIRLPGRPSLWASTATPGPKRRGVIPVAFLATGANLLLMGLSDTSAPWPVTLAAVLAPVVVGYFALRPLVSGPVFGRDGLRVVTGIVGWYCLYAAAIGLAGRFDLTVTAIAVAWLLSRLHRRGIAEPELAETYENP